MTFLQAVDRNLKQRKISRYRVAKDTGWSQSYIQLVLAGQLKGSIALFKDMSNYTGVSLDLLKEIQKD